MTNQEKRQFVTNLTSAVRDQVLEEIASGKVPETWDGIELRRYLARAFKAQDLGDFSPKRSRDFNNDCAVLGLRY